MSGLSNVCVDFSSDVEALLSNLWPFAPEEQFTALAQDFICSQLVPIIDNSRKAHNQ